MSETLEIQFNEKNTASGLLGEVVLSRPQAMNALTFNMCKKLYEQLQQWEKNSALKAVVIKGKGDRAFCAGGDIRKLYETAQSQKEMGTQFFAQEYRLNQLIFHFSKPYIALLHGVSLGGGLGISLHGRYRIATEDLRLGMPETKIGFFPDIGAFNFLNQCSGQVGLYLALSGDFLDGASAKKLGLIDFLIPNEKMTALEAAIEAADVIDESVFEAFAIQHEQTEIDLHRDVIAQCFSASSVTEIIMALKQTDAWGFDLAQRLEQCSPTSLQITYEAYKKSLEMNFDEIIQMNFDLAQSFLNDADFFEGIRAMIIDKDRKPHWAAPRNSEQIRNYFQQKNRLA